MTRADIIRGLCKEKGMSVTNLEKELGFSNGSLTKRDGAGIKYERLIKIADYFNVPVSELTGINEEPAFQEGIADYKLMGKINKLNDANRALVESMIDTMIKSQN